MAKRSDHTEWQHDSAVYRRYTLVHFTYALVLTIPAALMLLALDLELAMVCVLAAEVLGFFVMPHLAWVRRAVDARLDARARAEAASARAVLLMRMSEEHRRELASLEKVVIALRERTDPVCHTEDFLGIERLIELYVRLAIAHRASKASLDTAGAPRIDEELLVLERSLTGSARQDRAIEKRLGILRLRRDARRAAVEEQEIIAHELALIAHTLRWMEEHSAAVGSEALRHELDFVLAGRERDATTLRELAALRDADFDGNVIRLGRDYPRSRRDVPLVRVALPPLSFDEEPANTVTPEPEAIAFRM